MNLAPSLAGISLQLQGSFAEKDLQNKMFYETPRDVFGMWKLTEYVMGLHSSERINAVCNPHSASGVASVLDTTNGLCYGSPCGMFYII